MARRAFARIALCCLLALLGSAVPAVALAGDVSAEGASSAGDPPRAAPAAGGILPEHGADDPFTIVMLPDTQYYSQSYPHIFMAQTEWIAAMADELNIRLVLHAGDVVNTGARSEEQWINAKAAMDVLDRAGIPTFIAIGNHDYDDEARTRSAEKFNEYFGIDRYEGKAWFGGSFEAGRSENVYGFIEAGGIPFLVMALEFGPRKEVIGWANEVIASHPDRDVLVITHAYMYYDDTRMSPGDSWNPKDYGVGTDATDGEDMWRELFSRHPNVRMILSGHVLGTGVGRRIDAGEAGNAVHQILANYQIRPQGGEGYLRIMRFFPALGIVEVTTYSPYLDRYLEDETQRFVLAYRRGVEPPAEIEGTVVDAARGGGIAGAVISTRSESEFFGVERSGEAGEFALRVPPGMYRLQVSREGFFPGEVEIAAAPGPNRLAVELLPLPFATVSVGGIAPQLSDWTAWFSGVVDVRVELGPEELAPAARIGFNRVVQGEIIPLQELYQGTTPPGPIVIDTTALEDGTYEITVDVEAAGGLTARSVARFGVRNWEETVDNLLPPVHNAWFGTQVRKRTVSESPGWAYVTDSPDAYFGDQDRLVRVGAGEEWLVWEAPKLHSFEIVLYAADARDVERVVTLAVSSDGVVWMPVEFAISGAVAGGDGTSADGDGGAFGRDVRAADSDDGTAGGDRGVADGASGESGPPTRPETAGGTGGRPVHVVVAGTVPAEIEAGFLRLTLAGEEPSGVGIQLGQVRLLSYLAK